MANLASAAKWSDEAAAKFNAYLERLADIADPKPPRPVTRRTIKNVFAALGIPFAPDPCQKNA